MSHRILPIIDQHPVLPEPRTVRKPFSAALILVGLVLVVGAAMRGVYVDVAIAAGLVFTGAALYWIRRSDERRRG